MEIQQSEKPEAIPGIFGQELLSRFETLIIHRKVKILNANQGVIDMFGYESAELVNLTILDLILPEARSTVLKNTLTHYAKPYQVVGLRKNGSTFPLEIFHDTTIYQGHPIQITVFQANGETHHVEQVLAALVQSKQQLEEKVRESTTQLRFANERLRLELDERVEMEAKLRVQARQQAAVAELGQRALVGTPLAVLLAEAVALVRQTLAADYVAFLEFIPERNLLMLQSVAGWQAELVGQAELYLNGDTPAGRCFMTNEVVIIEELPFDDRFKAAVLLHERHIISGIWLVVQGRRGPAGVLEVCTVKQRSFSEDDRHFLQAIANILAMTIERSHTEAQMKEALQEKELLLREIHHRVKNNLQVISSLLELQLECISDEAIQKVFRESQHRIRSMALLHQELYRSSSLANIDMSSYIPNLLSYLSRSYNAPERAITFETQIAQVSLDIDRAIPFGLILNELVSNALRHAFPHRQSGTISVTLSVNTQKRLILTVSDNGIGFPANMEVDQSETLGLQLVRSLISQLNGKYEFKQKLGTTFTLMVALD